MGGKLMFELRGGRIRQAVVAGAPGLVVRSLLFAALAASQFADSGIARAALIPFLEDFQDGLAQGFNAFSTNPASGVTITQEIVEPTPDDFGYRLGVDKGSSTSGPTMHSNVQLTNVGDAIASGGLSISADLTLVEGLTDRNTFFGLRFLAATNNTNANSYLVDIGGSTSNPGQVRIVRYNDAGGASTGGVTVTDNGTVSGFSTGNTYHMVVNLTYNNDGDLGVEARVTGIDGFDKTAVLDIPIANPLSGEYFGMRFNFATGAASGPVTADFDNFSVVAVPEPGAGLIAAVLGMALATRRWEPRGRLSIQ
jgi:hypothetical protein